MAIAHVPSVFISSTCYDLSQIRLDLKTSIEEMGLDPIISESFAFPVNPQEGTIENCLRVVKDRADIFVLIVGARYGAQTESGHSVTNLEYFEAKSKRIPIYVFVNDAVLHQLPIWKRNPEGDYSGIVDDPKLFKFVDEIRNSKEHWVFSFVESRNISETLRAQLAYLFKDALLLRRRVTESSLPEELADLPAEALRLAYERPYWWEYLFFSSVLANEVKKNRDLQRELKYCLRCGQIKDWETDNLSADIMGWVDWIKRKLADIRALGGTANGLLNIALKEAMRPAGTPGDPEHIAYVAKRLASLHRDLLRWTIDFQEVNIRPECKKAHDLVAKFSDDIINKVENIASSLKGEISKGLEAKQRGDQYSPSLMIVLDSPPSERLNEELQKLVLWIGSQR